MSEFSNPIPNPSDSFPKYFETRITLGPKKQAIPIPIINLNTMICAVSLANPVTNAADEAIMIPYSNLSRTKSCSHDSSSILKQTYTEKKTSTYYS